ncbi:MAG: sigma-70 family RNA polymerase sigma factor [Candidatus Aureabacteria bacterium]|nr:sigma-70 family RNA polymerase sigma factor [Candidatus Auribacterota bacterium]
MNDEPTAPADDRELIRRCLDGEINEFRGVVEKYQERIRLLIYGIIFDRHLAEDLAQEAFIRAYQALARFKGESTVYTWLYRIAVNLALDAKRRLKRAPVDSLDDVPEAGMELPQSSRLRPDRQAATEELNAAMRRGMEGLSDTHRTVLVLREWEGLSYQEIAAATGSSAGTVMSRLYYAREKMREHLEKYFRGEKT